MSSVVIVDDSKETCEAITRLVEREGHRAIPVEHSDEAADVVRAVRPDVVLLDVMMPGKNGLEVLRRIREDRDLDRTAVVMCTAVDDEEVERAARELGANDYVVKSSTWERVWQCIGRFVKVERPVGAAGDPIAPDVSLADVIAGRTEGGAAMLSARVG